MVAAIAIVVAFVATMFALALWLVNRGLLKAYDRLHRRYRAVYAVTIAAYQAVNAGSLTYGKTPEEIAEQVEYTRKALQSAVAIWAEHPDR